MARLGSIYGSVWNQNGATTRIRLIKGDIGTVQKDRRQDRDGLDVRATDEVVLQT